jgi:beta-lactamase class A
MMKKFANNQKALAMKFSVLASFFSRIQCFVLLFSTVLSCSITGFVSAEVEKENTTETDFPLIRDSRDPQLQSKLFDIVKELKLGALVKSKQIGIALVDITDPTSPRFAGVNGDSMMYAASLPKIAILFGVFKKIEEGDLQLNDKILAQADAMISRSSNIEATNLLNLVGIEYLANLLQSPEYLLYEKNRGGGLWVGKEYGKGAAWRRDPINQLSHGATPLKVARFYYMLETNRLVNPELTEQMKSILVDPALHHKFVKGLEEICPAAKIYRKSGSWRNWHSDSAIVSHGGKKYIAVVLIQHEKGGEWLPQLIKRFDRLIFAGQLQTGCDV